VQAVQSTLKRFCCLAGRGPSLCLALAFTPVGLATPTPTQTEAQTRAQTQAPLATICLEASGSAIQVVWASCSGGRRKAQTHHSIETPVREEERKL
jgi:hypothetical protein